MFRFGKHTLYTLTEYIWPKTLKWLGFFNILKKMERKLVTISPKIVKCIWKQLIDKKGNYFVADL